MTGGMGMLAPEPGVFVCADPEAVAAEVVRKWIERARACTEKGRPFRVALSGGSTPRLLFEGLARPENRGQVDWTRVHLFWGDERCVPPDHPESNYNLVRQTLLEHIAIPDENVHRIRGEDDPETEARRYAEELRRAFGIGPGTIPRFDWIFLGMGGDGHTASLFPGQGDVLESKELCAVAVQPESGQKRITLTLTVLNHAVRVSFLVTGAGKADMLERVLHDPKRRELYPAARVQAESTEWWVDREAARRLQGARN